MISVTVDTSQVDTFLRDLDMRMAGFSIPIAEVLEQALMDAQHFVGVSKGVWGVPWPPMAVTTAQRRDPSTLMVKSRKLLDSLEQNMPGNVFHVEDHSGYAGTRVFYAPFQQYGSTRHPRRPPRPFLVWTEERMGPGPELGGEYLAIFERYLFSEAA